MIIERASRGVFARFLAGLQFLTILPVQIQRPVSLSQAAIVFPAVGAMLGAVAGGVMLLSRQSMGASIATLGAVIILIALTGGLHEDGLADVADGCRAGRTPETILRIMKDSRIGVYGALALIVSVMVRWQALSRCRINPVLGLVAALSLSRTAMVGLAGFSLPAGNGLGGSFVRGQSRPAVFATIILGVMIALACARWSGLAMAIATGVTVLGARAYFARRIGGVTGDCLGATCQVSEMLNLLILAWQPSI